MGLLWVVLLETLWASWIWMSVSQVREVFSHYFFEYFFFKKNIYLFFWLCWVLAVACGIFFVVACGTFTAACRIFSCSMWTLSCSLRTLSCGMWDLVPWPGIEPGPPALGAWNLSHWTTREVPIISLNKLFAPFSISSSSGAFIMCILVCLLVPQHPLSYLTASFKNFSFLLLWLHSTALSLSLLILSSHWSSLLLNPSWIFHFSYCILQLCDLFGI